MSAPRTFLARSGTSYTVAADGALVPAQRGPDIYATVRRRGLRVDWEITAGPHDRAELKAAIAAAVRNYHGVRGCAAEMAVAFGEHPAQAAKRMRWARHAAEPLAFHQGVRDA